MKLFLKLGLLFIVFSISFILPNIIFPLPMKAEAQGEPNSFLILALFLIDLIFIAYLILRLNLTGWKLFIAVLVVFWGLRTFMTQSETWYFREAMPVITDSVLVLLFTNPLITVVIFGPIAIWVLGRWRQPEGQSISSFSMKFNWKELLTLSIVYMAIYFVFGYYVAWQFEAVRLFYSGNSELLGFTQQMQNTLHTKNLIIPFQVFRGLLWVLAGMPIVSYLKGSKTEKIIACVLFYSVLTSIPLIVDNPFMPADVRAAHLLEVSTSNGLFGLIIGIMASRKV